MILLNLTNVFFIFDIRNTVFLAMTKKFTSLIGTSRIKYVNELQNIIKIIYFIINLVGKDKLTMY